MELPILKTQKNLRPPLKCPFSCKVFIGIYYTWEVSEQMKQYIAFLRGINISGKNKVSMAELKEGFEKLDFGDVKTYLNSGNVIFSGDEDEDETFTNQIEVMIKKRFGLDIPVFVISKEELENILYNAPEWWGNGNNEIYDNLIFIMPPARSAEVYSEIGEPKADLETIKAYKNAIFWSFSRKDYQKTNWWSKTASAAISSKLTIRTANTVKKTVGM